MRRARQARLVAWDQATAAFLQTLNGATTDGGTIRDDVCGQLEVETCSNCNCGWKSRGPLLCLLPDGTFQLAIRLPSMASSLESLLVRCGWLR